MQYELGLVPSDIAIGAIRIRLGALRDDVSSGLGGNISKQFSVSLQTFPAFIDDADSYVVVIRMVSTAMKISIGRHSLHILHRSWHIVCCEVIPGLFPYLAHRDEMTRSPSLEPSACAERVLPSKLKCVETNHCILKSVRGS